MWQMRFSLAPELQRIVRPGIVWLDGATVVDREPRLDPPLAAAESAVRVHPPEEIVAVRTMYKRVGIDPTKRRPSSEALLRRVRKGDPLPRVNSMVDVCNWCSLEFQLPYGLYDASRIEGDVVLRLGHEGESYPGIRKDDVNVGGRIHACRHRRPVR
jgi:DNA/RNA-binding domain of Phe-tRNA-synthetase-like protein